MAATTQQRVRGRPARKWNSYKVSTIWLNTAKKDLPDPPGVTALAYTPNGKKLITVGANDVIRVYTTGSTGEPKNIDMCPENNLAVAATVSARVQETEN